MPAKIPTSKSLSWETIAALSPLAVLYSLYTKFGPVMGVSMTAPSLYQIAGYSLLTGGGIGGMMAVHDYISSLPHRRLKVAFENCKIYIDREAGIRLPRLKKRERKPWGWRFFYKLPIGLCKADFEHMREEIEAALDAEVGFAWHKGLLRIDALTGKIPIKVNFKEALKNDKVHRWSWPGGDDNSGLNILSSSAGGGADGGGEV